MSGGNVTPGQRHSTARAATLYPGWNYLGTYIKKNFPSSLVPYCLRRHVSLQAHIQWQHEKEIEMTRHQRICICNNSLTLTKAQYSLIWTLQVLPYSTYAKTFPVIIWWHQSFKFKSKQNLPPRTMCRLREDNGVMRELECLILLFVTITNQ